MYNMPSLAGWETFKDSVARGIKEGGHPANSQQGCPIPSRHIALPSKWVSHVHFSISNDTI